jgi:hypothetical protein
MKGHCASQNRAGTQISGSILTFLERNESEQAGCRNRSNLNARVDINVVYLVEQVVLLCKVANQALELRYSGVDRSGFGDYSLAKASTSVSQL